MFQIVPWVKRGDQLNFTLTVAQLAYGGKGGPELAYRFERFGK